MTLAESNDARFIIMWLWQVRALGQGTARGPWGLHRYGGHRRARIRVSNKRPGPYFENIVIDEKSCQNKKRRIEAAGFMSLPIIVQAEGHDNTFKNTVILCFHCIVFFLTTQVCTVLLHQSAHHQSAHAELFPTEFVVRDHVNRMTGEPARSSPPPKGRQEGTRRDGCNDVPVSVATTLKCGGLPARCPLRRQSEARDGRTCCT